MRAPQRKPIENLRPQHLVDALLWPEIRKEEAVLFEEFNDEAARYYVLTVLARRLQNGNLAKDLVRSRRSARRAPPDYGPKGALLSDVRYADWQPCVRPYPIGHRVCAELSADPFASIARTMNTAWT